MKKLLIAVAMSAMASTAMAEDTVKDDVNPWTQCGIGAAIFSDSEVGAGISNVIWDLGTTAVSSYATSPGTCSGSKMQVAAAEFIQNSHAVLEEDMAKGQGQHLAALMELMEVQDKAGFSDSVKAGFASLAASEQYQAMDAQAKSQAVYTMVMTNA